MTIEEKLKVLATCLRDLQGGEWSVREVLEFARAAGFHVREKTAYRVLYNFDLPGRRAGGRRQKGRPIKTPREAVSEDDSGDSQLLPGSSSGSSYGVVLDPPRGSHSLPPAPPSLYSPNPSLPLSRKLDNGRSRKPGSDFSLFEFSQETRTNTEKKRSSKPVDTSWIEPLLEAAKRVSSKPLGRLSVPERNTLGRYWAYLLCNCTREAVRNASAGVKIAAQIATMGSDLRFADLTAGELLSAGKKTRENMGGSPLWRVRDVCSVLVFD